MFGQGPHGASAFELCKPFRFQNLRQNIRNDIKREFAKYNNVDNIQHDIHPEINIRYNTLNIFVGQRGSGKTFNGFNEVVAISRINSKFHKFIYVSNNPNDETYKKFKPLLSIPHELVNYEHAEDVINELREYKQAYDEIKDKHLENKITEECKDEILDKLSIDDFNAQSLHTLIMYDDAMEVFKKPTSKQYRWMMENRHFRTTYILCIQDWKGIGSELKANIDSIWFFGGYPRNRYCYIFNQLSCPIDRDILYNVYKELNKRDTLIINHKSDGDEIKILYEDGKIRYLTI